MGIESIHINEAIAKAVSENGILIDVRSQKEFLEGHIPMAINVPLYEIQSGRFNLPRQRLLVLYCDNGLHSLMAARYLARRGYQVLNTIGGLSAYKKALTLKH